MQGHEDSAAPHLFSKLLPLQRIKPLQKTESHAIFHINNQKWNDITQQFTTFPDDTVLSGRSLEQSPMGIYGQNTGAICIENFGDFDLEKITAEQQQTIITWTAALCIKFNISPGINTII